MSYASLGSGSPSAKGSGGSSADAKATDGRSGVNLPRLCPCYPHPLFGCMEKNCISTQKNECLYKKGGWVGDAMRSTDIMIRGECNMYTSTEED